MVEVKMPEWKNPEEGTYAAVGTGAEIRTYEGKNGPFSRIIVKLQLDESQAGEVEWTPEGKEEAVKGRWTVRASLPYPKHGLSPKTGLWKWLEQIHGKNTREVIASHVKDKNLQLEELISGMNCIVTVSHEEGKDGRVYANVTNVMPPAKGQELKPVVYGPDTDDEKDGDLPF